MKPKTVKKFNAKRENIYIQIHFDLCFYIFIYGLSAFFVFNLHIFLVFMHLCVYLRFVFLIDIHFLVMFMHLCDYLWIFRRFVFLICTHFCFLSVYNLYTCQVHSCSPTVCYSPCLTLSWRCICSANSLNPTPSGSHI